MLESLLPTVELNSLSEWASILGLPVSLAGLILSIWVLNRTGNIQKAVRKTEAEMRLPSRIDDIDTRCTVIRDLSQTSPLEQIDIQGMVGKARALVLKLTQNEFCDRNTTICLTKASKALDQGNHNASVDDLRQLYMLFNELRSHLDDHRSRPEALRRVS